MKLKIASKSENPQRPYEHLLPIVDLLLAHGNEYSTDKAGFYLTQGGWICDFKNEIDFELVKEAFELPASIRFSDKENSILCDLSWIEVRGSVELR